LQAQVRKSSMAIVVLGRLVFSLPSAAQENRVRASSGLGGPPPVVQDDVPPNYVAEGFEDITNLPGQFMRNNSQPLGVTNWFQGNDSVFPAYAGTTTSCIGANFNHASDLGTMSNWLLTPGFDQWKIDTLSILTPGPTGSTLPDRLQVTYATAGSSASVGTLATDTGEFTNVALEIHPTYSMGGYPEVRTQFTLTSAEIGAPRGGRVALRYFVEDSVPKGATSDYIGIDSFEFCILEAVDMNPSTTSDLARLVAPVDTVVSTLDLISSGHGGANNVVVVDTLSAGVRYVSDACSASVTGRTVTWPVGSLSMGVMSNCDVTTTVDAGAAGTLTKSATASSDESNPNPADNSASADVEALGSVLGIPTLGAGGPVLLALLLMVASILVLRRRQLSRR
jgi:uncharacterized repeat protein (TIGR01451 family)